MLLLYGTLRPIFYSLQADKNAKCCRVMTVKIKKPLKPLLKHANALSPTSVTLQISFSKGLPINRAYYIIFHSK